MNDETSPMASPPLRSPVAALIAEQRPALRRGSSSDKTVRFAQDPSPPLLLRRPAFRRDATDASSSSFTVEMPATYPPPAQNPASTPAAPVRSTARPQGSIFGYHTAYKPLLLLGAGSVGNALYGTGTLSLERGIWPVRPVPMPGQPPPEPRLSPLFGNLHASFGLGIASMVGGIAVAVCSSSLFYADARRLARRQNPANPNYRRPTIYFGAHLIGIGLSAGGKFMAEALRDTVSRDYTWAAALPGIIGQAIFAVTLANSASGCEILNGRQPLKHRANVGFLARAGVAGYTCWAAMQSIPNFSPYGREIMRVLSQISLTVAYALPLTTARLGRHHGVDFTSHHPNPSWFSLQVLGVYIAGRVLAGFGPDIIQVGLYTNASTEPYVFGGATALAVGTGICVAALSFFRVDVAAYSPKRANWLFAGACFALTCILAYVGLAQYAGRMRRRDLIGASLVPGVIGAGLRLAIVPSLFSFSELRHGDVPLPDRLYWVEGCRAIAAVCFGVWGLMSAQPTVNIYLREAVAVAAGSFATLGMALPTTTSRRALPQYAFPLSPGATPTGEMDGFTWGQAFSPHTTNPA